MFKPTPKLNLHIPRGWNECSIEELETIADILRERALVATSFHPFSMSEVKTAVFFAFSKLTVVETLNPRVNVEDQFYLCTHPDVDGEFAVYLWQLDYWINGVPSGEEPKKDKKGNLIPPKKKVVGLLDWLDDSEGQGLLLFPYEVVRRQRTFSFRHLHSSLCGKSFHGPEALMQDFSWQRYRFAQEYMSYYMDQQNILLRLQRKGSVVPFEELHKQYKTVDSAKSLFLATIFNAKIKYVTTDTKQVVRDYAYASNQHTDNAEFFRDFPDTQWQVILFWWSGMMQYLQKHYPRCFKRSEVKGEQKNPLELYTRTVATMEKYLALDEEKVNRESFHNVLQHLEDMAKENEELEKVRSKNKVK